MGRDLKQGDERCGEDEARSVDREGGTRPDQRNDPAGDRGREDLHESASGPRHRVRSQSLLRGGEHRDDRVHGRIEEGAARG